MKLPEICIQRPVLSWVMTFVIIVLGIVGLTRMPVQFYPKFERPQISIETTLHGASPEVVETQITKVIEEALAGVEGIDEISSNSSFDTSKVSVQFNASRRMDEASNDVRDRLSRIQEKLGPEATQPTIIKSRADDMPVMILSLTSATLKPSEMADTARYVMQKEIEAIPGVSQVEIGGAGHYKMHIQLDPVKLSAHGVMVTDVIQSIRRQNVEKPSGRLTSFDREYQVTVLAGLESPEEFSKVIVSSKGGHIIHLRDVISKDGIFVSADDKKTLSLYNGLPSIQINVKKQSTANPMEVSQDVQRVLIKLKKKMPDAIDVSISSNTAIEIEKSINHVYKAILEAVFLVILVVFVFLRSAKASLVPIVTIPVSLIGAFFIMYVLGFSINVFTLMAMVLAVGLVVDDAIVVLENVYRYLEEGVNSFKASALGIREITFAVIAMTLTLVAVYAPVSLAPGKVGKLFKEFSITLAGAVLLSGFAALTLSPMMCARLLKNEKDTKNFAWWDKVISYLPTDAYFKNLENQYVLVLTKHVLTNKLRAIGYGISFFLVGLVMYKLLPQIDMPDEERSIIVVDGHTEQGSTLNFTKKYAQQIDGYISKISDVESRTMEIKDSSKFVIYVQLKEIKERKTKEIQKDIEQYFEKMSNVAGKVYEGGASGGSGQVGVDIAIGGNVSYLELRGIFKRFIQDLHSTRLGSQIMATSESNVQDFVVTVNRDKASNLDIDPITISDTLGALIKGSKSGEFKKNNRMYDVMVEVNDQARQSPDDITDLFVKVGERQGMRAHDKEIVLVPISELISVHSRSTIPMITHYGLNPSLSLRINLRPGIDMMTAIKTFDQLALDKLPEGVHIDYIGETKQFLEESGNIIFVFALALIFIYLVMAAQFESWRDPFVIMLSVPLSLSGAIVTLFYIPDGSINLYSQIGLVTLIGLITKHGILMVDFANSMIDHGKPRIDAILESCKLRLRPILMTTFAMVLGALPLALSSGAGSGARRQIGWVIVGGMSIGTVFTLLLLPVVYILMGGRRPKLPSLD
jgi:multidrug efflux pump